MNNVRRTCMRTQIRDLIIERILDGTYPAGTRLKEMVLASEFQVSQAPVREAPSPDAPLMTEALLGERVTVYEFDDEGWAWGQLADDGYVGWLPANALLAPRSAPTHKVTALRTLVFPGPSIKLPPVAMPPLGSAIAVTHNQNQFAVSAIGFVPSRHLAPPATAARRSGPARRRGRGRGRTVIVPR